MTRSALKDLSREKQQEKLAALARTNRIAAIDTAKRLYNCSLADAMKMIDELTAKP
jgi:hypothetical protein